MVPSARRLRRLQFDTTNRPIDAFLALHRAGELDLDPPYQRGSVWSEDDKAELIRSLLEGVPIGAVFINYRGGMEPYRVVDGKQRIEAIHDFLEGCLRVPAGWFDGATELLGIPDEQGTVSYLDLTEAAARRFRINGTLAVYETRLPTEDDERRLFDRINFTGAPMGDHGPQSAESDEIPIAQWVPLREASHRIGMQSQYVSRYLTGVGGEVMLGEGLRHTPPGSGGDYHAIMIHPDDLEEFIARVERHRASSSRS